MASFYGGSPGLSMMIVKSYLTKESMIEDFKTLNCTVGIGECVCIDSGLNDRNHGDIYRRALDPNNPEYVGNMSGPMGPGINFGAKVVGTLGEDISTQIKSVLGDKHLEVLKNKNILFEDKNGGGAWIYAYDHNNDTPNTWFRVGSYHGYDISDTKPNGLAANGLWLFIQEAPGTEVMNR